MGINFVTVSKKDAEQRVEMETAQWGSKYRYIPIKLDLARRGAFNSVTGAAISEVFVVLSGRSRSGILFLTVDEADALRKVEELTAQVGVKCKEYESQLCTLDSKEYAVDFNGKQINLVYVVLRTGAFKAEEKGIGKGWFGESGRHSDVKRLA